MNTKHKHYEYIVAFAEGKFWLASGNNDVRYSGAETVGEAIEWVKEQANNCRGES